MQSEPLASKHSDKSYRAMSDSFVQPEKQSLPVRILSKIDIFSFIPVPKDDPVSTRQSLIGTTLFFVIFLSYIIYDFYTFVTDNPPNAQNYYTKLNSQQHVLPRFAITFMDGEKLDQTEGWERYFKFSLSQNLKNRGTENSTPVPMNVNWFKPDNDTPPDTIDWINTETKQFYNVLRTPSQDMTAKGLLYSTDDATFSRIKIQMCNVTQSPEECEELETIKKKCGGGRIFLFVENIFDTTDFGESSELRNKFLIYNFFLIPMLYKRVTFNFQVVETVVEPDWFFRLSEQKQTRLQIETYIEQTSDVTRIMDPPTKLPLDMLSINFQLSPQILNVRVVYKTLIDMVSLWGAFWGVLFAIFAIIFLTYNRKKFYKKNPDWDKFKQNMNGNDQNEAIFSVSKSQR